MRACSRSAPPRPRRCHARTAAQPPAAADDAGDHPARQASSPTAPGHGRRRRDRRAPAGRAAAVRAARRRGGVVHADTVTSTPIAEPGASQRDEQRRSSQLPVAADRSAQPSRVQSQPWRASRRPLVRRQGVLRARAGRRRRDPTARSPPRGRPPSPVTSHDRRAVAAHLALHRLVAGQVHDDRRAPRPTPSGPLRSAAAGSPPARTARSGAIDRPGRCGHGSCRPTPLVDDVNMSSTGPTSSPRISPTIAPVGFSRRDVGLRSGRPP